MTPAQIAEALRLHSAWLLGDAAGVRANLRYATLRSADLSGADLSGADLRGAYLRYATLRSADLRGADLRGADLRGANLRYATLRSADLRGADLRSADLRGAYLRYATLRYATLRSADLRGADLRGTCLDPAATVPPCDDTNLASSGLHPRRVNGRDRVYGWRTANSPHVGSHDYTPGRWHRANALSVDRATECHPGIYFGGQAHCPGPAPGRVLVWAYRDELVWVSAEKGARARRVWVVGERDEVPNG